VDLDEVFIRLIEDRPRPRGSKTSEADLKRLAELARDQPRIAEGAGLLEEGGGCGILQDWLLGELRKRLSELVGSETDRFLKFKAILNIILEEGFTVGHCKPRELGENRKEVTEPPLISNFTLM
jgi:hypothetical protein